MDLKVCKCCGLSLPISKFASSSQKRINAAGDVVYYPKKSSYCNKCVYEKYNKGWVKRNPEKNKISQYKSRRKNSEKYKKIQDRYRAKVKENLTDYYLKTLIPMNNSLINKDLINLKRKVHVIKRKIEQGY